MAAFKNAITAFLLLFAAVFANTASGAVFVAAHPDDIAYLMNRNAQLAVRNDDHVVYLLVTAGDASNRGGIADNTKNIPYYRARLRAHEMYVHFWQGLDSEVSAPLPVYSVQTIKGKKVETVRMGNAVLYNLNLPDDGTLARLGNRQIASVTSISPINTYTLTDLKNVIREIIRINNLNKPIIEVHTHEPDTGWNPEDHTDHVATGTITNAALSEISAYNCISRGFYKGYIVALYPVTYTEDELQIQIATIGVLNAGLIENGNKSTWNGFHNNFFGKMDVRWVAGRGTCAF